MQKSCKYGCSKTAGVHAKGMSGKLAAAQKSGFGDNGLQSTARRAAILGSNEKYSAKANAKHALV